MKKSTLKFIGVILMAMFLSGCYDVAGPTPALAEVDIPVPPPAEVTGTIRIKGVTVDLKSNELSIEAFLIYTGKTTSIEYSITGMRCGITGMLTRLASSTGTIHDGEFFQGALNYTYTSCSLSAGSTFEVIFKVEDLTTGLTWTQVVSVITN